MKLHRRWLWQSALGNILAIFTGLSLAGYESSAYRRQVQQPTQSAEEKRIVIEESSVQEEILPGISQMTPDGPEYERLKDLPVPGTDPVPEYYGVGVEHESVAKLQERLMELGLMDNDEPTEYYGTVTQAAVKFFQRQNGLHRSLDSWWRNSFICGWRIFG